MPESQDREFIREKIIDKAAGKRHRIWKIVRTLVMAVVFGLVASLFFVLGKRFLEPRLLPEESSSSETITINRDDLDESDTSQEDSASLTETEETVDSTSETEETSPEETEESETGEISPEESLAEQIQAAASQAAAEELKQQEDYLALGMSRKLSAVLKSVNKGLVTITSVTEDTDWFHNPVSSAYQSSGAVIYTTDAEVLILADYEAIKDAGALTVTFSAGRPVEARIKKADSLTGIAIVSVSKGALTNTIWNNITTLTLGNSYQVSAGNPVFAAGCPAGYTGSVTSGLISLVQTNTVGTDTAFQLIYSDIHMAEAGGGFLFNLEGEIIGILTSGYGDEATGLPAAIGISSLKGFIEKMSSGIDIAYLGIQGQNATAEIAEAYDMPKGIYVSKVIVDSPAYLAGLKAGDVIVGSSTGEILTTLSLQSFLEDYSTGDVITLKAYRAGQDEYVEMEFEVTLGSR